jgi:hypothetical protein
LNPEEVHRRSARYTDDHTKDHRESLSERDSTIDSSIKFSAIEIPDDIFDNTSVASAKLSQAIFLNELNVIVSESLTSISDLKKSLPKSIKTKFKDLCLATFATAGTWSAAGNTAMSVIIALHAPSTAAQWLSWGTALFHISLGALGVYNNYRETYSNNSPQDQSGTNQNISSTYGKLIAGLKSPGFPWGVVGTITLINSFTLTISGAPLDGLMCGLFSVGQFGAYYTENLKFHYWEKKYNAPAGVELGTPLLKPLMKQPGLTWCLGDIIAGIRELDISLCLSSVSAMSFAISGLTLGVIGPSLAIYFLYKGKDARKPEKNNLAEAVPTIINALQNLSFAFAYGITSSSSCFPLAFWTVSSFLLGINALKRKDNQAGY